MAPDSTDPTTDEPPAYYPDLPLPTTDDALETLVATIAERAVSAGLDNAYDMNSSEQFIAAHLGTQLHGYVDVEMDRLTELGIFEGRTDRTTATGALQQAAYRALRDAVVEAAIDYAENHGYTIYEPATDEANDATPDVYLVGRTDVTMLPYPDDEATYQAALYVLADDTLTLAREDADVDGPGSTEIARQHVATQYAGYTLEAIRRRAPDRVPFTDEQTDTPYAVTSADENDPATAADLAQWRLLAKAVAEAVPDVASDQDMTVYKPRDD